MEKPKSLDLRFKPQQGPTSIADHMTEMMKRKTPTSLDFRFKPQQGASSFSYETQRKK